MFRVKKTDGIMLWFVMATISTMKSDGTHTVEKRICGGRINGVLAKFMNEESTMVTILPPFGYNGFSIDERTDSDKAQDIIVPSSSIKTKTMFF